MNTSRITQITDAIRSRRAHAIGSRRTWIAAAAASLALLSAGCNQDEAWNAFRSGASDSLQAGAQAIMTGVINGAFSAFDLKNGDEGSANTSGATASSGTSSSATTP